MWFHPSSKTPCHYNRPPSVISASRKSNYYLILTTNGQNPLKSISLLVCPALYKYWKTGRRVRSMINSSKVPHWAAIGRLQGPASRKGIFNKSRAASMRHMTRSDSSDTSSLLVLGLSLQNLMKVKANSALCGQPNPLNSTATSSNLH